MSSLAAAALVYCNIPVLSNVLFIFVILGAVNTNLNTTCAVALYPTSLRSTAISITLISGRIGSIIGSYVIAFLFNHYCEAAYIASAVMYLTCVIIPHLLPKSPS